jgi:hypothetical protein
MVTSVESRGFADDVEPVTLLTEGAAGLAAIVLAIIALAGVSPGALIAIAAIVIGVGLMVQAFNSAAEQSNMMTMMTTAMAAPAGVSRAEFGGSVMVDCMCGLTGIVLGILALVGINPAHLLPPALIVFGGALLVGGAACMRPTVRSSTVPAGVAGSEPRAVVAYPGSSFAASGMEILIGLAAIILGIVSLLVAGTGILVAVGFIAVGAALLLASATFSGAVMRLFATA